MVSERALNAGRGRIVYLKLRDPVRYDYSILTPRFRPLSVLAKTIRNEWRTEMIGMLNDVGAAPEATAFADVD